MLRLQSVAVNFPSRLRNPFFKSGLLPFLLFLLPFLLFLLPNIVHGADVTIRWDKSPESIIAGYKFHYGTSSGNYEFSVDVENYDSCSISELTEGQTYYFAATSSNVNNFENLLSILLTLDEVAAK